MSLYSPMEDGLRLQNLALRPNFRQQRSCVICGIKTGTLHNIRAHIAECWAVANLRDSSTRLSLDLSFSHHCFCSFALFLKAIKNKSFGEFWRSLSLCRKIRISTPLEHNMDFVSVTRCTNPSCFPTLQRSLWHHIDLLPSFSFR
jgi:hypothetical protein